MGLVSIISLFMIGMIFKDVVALPCLKDESKTKFEGIRKALSDLQTSIDAKIGSLQNDVKNKVKKLDDDIGSLVSDFQKRQWKKYNGHCYYYGSDARSWFLAEQSCKQIGGHLAKVDDAEENKWIIDNRSEQNHYWIGLTDLKEGEWRWSYDQTIATYKPWMKGRGSQGTSNNCGLLYHNTYTWFDEHCNGNHKYVCESHFYSSDTDESFVDETRVWRKYKISILISMMILLLLVSLLHHRCTIP